MQRLKSLPRMLFVTLCLWGQLDMAGAAIISEGDVVPNPQTAPWTTWTVGFVGKTGKGTLTVNEGDHLHSRSGYVGSSSGSSGEVAIVGTGSSWVNTDDIYVGDAGSGTLTISEDGSVSVTGTTYLAYGASSTGTILFGPGGGTLSTGTLCASPGYLTGTGTINTRGLVSDIPLTFDTATDLSQTLNLHSAPDQNVIVNLDMSDPVEAGALGAGYEGSGSVRIQNGTSVHSSLACIGFKSGSSGTATVSGTDSTWTNHGNLYVGYRGTGTLAINHAGTVNSDRGYLGYESGSTGTMTVSGDDSRWINSYVVSIGHEGHGILTVADGGTISNTSAFIGHQSGATGTVTLSDAGTTWTSSGSVHTGYYGNGTLAISNGATVGDGYGYVAFLANSTGTATVSGAGSTWTHDHNLAVGYYGDGMLTIADGGTVAALRVGINDQSLLAIEVGNDSGLVTANGKGTINNNGTVRIIAGRGPSPGTVYKPILAGTWEGEGTYEAMGGTWNNVRHEFTVSAVRQGTSGVPISLDLAAVQRVVVDDPTSAWTVAASFLTQVASTTLDFTATAVTEAGQFNLENILYPDDSLLNGWEFTASAGYTHGDPIYLSFGIGPDQSLDDLRVWALNEMEWTEFAPRDLTYDGTNVSFTVSHLSSYAVTVSGGMSIPGDTNGDHRVDQTDAAALAAHWGQNGGWRDGDFNGDGMVSAADAAILAANWSPATERAPVAGVPEPSAIALLLALGGMALARREKGGRGSSISNRSLSSYRRYAYGSNSSGVNVPVARQSLTARPSRFSKTSGS